MSVLGDLLRFHGVENDELLDALDWKYRRIEDERAKLREEKAELHTELVGLTSGVNELLNENVRLREIEARNVALIIRIKELENALAKEAGK